MEMKKMKRLPTSCVLQQSNQRITSESLRTKQKGKS